MCHVVKRKEGSFCCGWLVWDILWTLRIFWTFCGRFTDIFRYMDSSDLGGKAGKYRMDQKKIVRIIVDAVIP